MQLTNDQYTRGAQCMKILWLDKYKPETFDPNSMVQEYIDNNPAILDQANSFFGEYVEVPFDGGDTDGMVTRTLELIEAKTPVITNAVIGKDDRYALVDILRVEEDGVRIVDVKTSLVVKEHYYHDLAFQYYVLAKCGLTVKSASVLHLNGKYELEGDVDVTKLFVEKDLTADIVDMQRDMYYNIRQIDKIMEGPEDAEEFVPEEPKIYVNTQCMKPYTCGYRGWCWRYIPLPSIFDLGDLNTDAAFTAHARGITSFQDALDKLTLNDFQRVQATSYVEGQKTMVDAEGVKAFLDTVSGDPLFVDIEAPRQIVPQYDGVSPYGRVPWAFSVRKADGSVVSEFVGEDDVDNRAALAAQLAEAVAGDAPVVVYDIKLANELFTSLAVCNPDVADALDAAKARFVDLETPFAKGAYYVPQMLGSHSLDSVMGAVLANDRDIDDDNPSVRALAMTKIWNKLVDAAK